MSLKSKYSAGNKAYSTRPTWRFAFSHPAHTVALFFGAGCLHPAPGTWGSAAGVLVWILLVKLHTPLAVLIALIAFLFFLGAWAAGKTGVDLGVQDAGCIVVDEVAAVWLVCLMMPQKGLGWGLSFVLFRFFDIVKLPPAAQIDERMHSGLGVMLDDIFAALWAIAAALLADYVCFALGVHFLGVFR